MARIPRAVISVTVLAAVAGCAGGPASHPAPLSPAPQAVGIDTPQPDSDQTGAVSTITPNANGAPYANLVEQLFQGQIPGVQVVTGPDGSPRLQIRGAVQDVRGQGPEPLVIIDGLASQLGALQALKGIPPNQIAKIQILKDVSSTAIYGTRGAGGVILVTLKNN